MRIVILHAEIDAQGTGQPGAVAESGAVPRGTAVPQDLDDLDVGVGEDELVEREGPAAEREPEDPLRAEGGEQDLAKHLPYRVQEGNTAVRLPDGVVVRVHVTPQKAAVVHRAVEPVVEKVIDEHPHELQNDLACPGKSEGGFEISSSGL